jgi:hypothetical protein
MGELHEPLAFLPLWAVASVVEGDALSLWYAEEPVLDDAIHPEMLDDAHELVGEQANRQAGTGWVPPMRLVYTLSI